MLRPTRVLRCRNAAPSPPPSLDSSGFDLYEPGTWVHNGGNHATPDEKILALTNCLEQQKTQLLQHEDCWEFVRLIVPFLLNTNPTVVQYTVSCIKTFLKPKPSGLPPLIETINNFDLYEPGTWVHFPGEYPTETEKITALTKHIEQHKDTLLTHAKHWVNVRTNICFLFEEDSTATVTYIKGFLKPKPSGLPPLIEKINKLKATPWNHYDPVRGVGFAGSLVLGLEKGDTARFVLPPDHKSDWLGIKDAVFAWGGGVPRLVADVTKEHDSVLVVTGESGAGKTMVLLLLLKVILERLQSIAFSDTNFALDRVAAVTLYVKPMAHFRSEWDRTEEELQALGGLAHWRSQHLQIPAETIQAVKSDRTKRLLYHLVDLTPDQTQAFRGVVEDAALRAALKSWKEMYKLGRHFEDEDEFNRKIVRNYIMYELLVKAARSQLQTTREGTLLPMLLTYEAAGSTMFDSSAVVVLAVDEIGSDVDASRAVCAVRKEVYAALFGKSSNVLFRMAVAGTGLAASNLPPGSMPGDYHVHHVQPMNIFEAHMKHLFGDNEHVCTRLISAVREQPYFNSLTQNARMAALFAQQLKSLFQFHVSTDKVMDWVFPSIAELQAAGMVAAKHFKQLNGLQALQIAKGKSTIFASLLRAMALHMVPYPNNLDGPFGESLQSLGRDLGLVTDRATWKKRNEVGQEVYLATSGQVLACPSGSSRYELNRGMLSILSLLVFGFIPQRSTSGEGLETAAAMTVMLIVAALRDRPMEVVKRVLRYGEPLTPSNLAIGRSPIACERFDDFDKVCAAMKWERPAAAGAARGSTSACYLKQLKSASEEKAFINDVRTVATIDAGKETDSASKKETTFIDAVRTSKVVVAAALSPPKASFADAVVGLKKHNDKSNGLLVLIQSKDLHRDLPLYSFFYENNKMGHRGVQSIAGYLAKSAPFAEKPKTPKTSTAKSNPSRKKKKDPTPKQKETLDKNAVVKLQLAIFEVVPSLETDFAVYWENLGKNDSETLPPPADLPSARPANPSPNKAVRNRSSVASPKGENHANDPGKTRPAPTDQDRIDWLCSLDRLPRADIFTGLCDEAGLNRLKSKFTEEQWAALPFVAPCEKLKALKAAYGADEHVMFVTYCTSESVPLALRTYCGDKEVCIDWRKIRDKDIGILLSDSMRLLCTLPTNEQPIGFEATVSDHPTKSPRA